MHVFACSCFHVCLKLFLSFSQFVPVCERDRERVCVHQRGDILSEGQVAEGHSADK